MAAKNIKPAWELNDVARKIVTERAADDRLRGSPALPVVSNIAWREYFVDPPNELHSVRRRSSVCLNEGISAKWL